MNSSWPAVQPRALPPRPVPVYAPSRQALARALDRQGATLQRGRASDALGRSILDLLWRPLQEDDEAGIAQRMQALRGVFDSVPDDQAGAVLARLAPGGNLQRDFDGRLHRASRRRLRAGLRARARAPSTHLPLPPIPPVTPIPPHQVPPYAPPPVPVPPTTATPGLSPQFILGWQWTSERRRLGLSKLIGTWKKVPGLQRVAGAAKMVEAFFVLEAIPRVRAAVPGHRVVEVEVLFSGSGLKGEIEGDLGALPGTAKFGMEGGKPSADLSVKGRLSRFELQLYFNGAGAFRGLLPDGPAFARMEGKTLLDLGTRNVPGLDVPVSVECELIAAVEFRWSLGGIIREIADDGAKRVIRRLKDWLRGAAGRAVALWGRRVWWVLGAGLVLWWLLDDDDAPDDELERFDPAAWRDAKRWAAAQPQAETLATAIDEAGDAAQESFGTGLADTLHMLQKLGNRASAQLDTMAASPYGSNNGFADLPGLDEPFERWLAWAPTSGATRERQSRIDLADDDWLCRMQIVQRVAMAGRAARAAGRLSRDAWTGLLGKIKWHANAAGIACAVQSLRGWRDGNDFHFLDEKGRRHHRDGAAQLTDAFKLIQSDGRSDDERRERARRIAWMMLAG